MFLFLFIYICTLLLLITYLLLQFYCKTVTILWVVKEEPFQINGITKNDKDIYKSCRPWECGILTIFFHFVALQLFLRQKEHRKICKWFKWNFMSNKSILKTDQNIIIRYYNTSNRHLYKFLNNKRYLIILLVLYYIW